jgi:hypothetical protein
MVCNPGRSVHDRKNKRKIVGEYFRKPRVAGFESDSRQFGQFRRYIQIACGHLIYSTRFARHRDG